MLGQDRLDYVTIFQVVEVVMLCEVVHFKFG
jgi:hypothetical protein